MQHLRQSEYYQQVKRLINLVIRATDALEINDYQTYVHLLKDIGEYSHALYIRANTTTPEEITWLKDFISKYVNHKILVRNSLGYYAFAQAWSDSYLKKHRALSAKAKLNRSTRQRIHLGMQVFSWCTLSKATPTHKLSKLESYDALAYAAIASYKTSLQRILAFTGKALAGIMAVTCGFAAGATVLSWSIPYVNALALIAFVGTVLTNWLTFKTAVPEVLIDVFGRDQWFGGWRQYYDKETGARTNMSMLGMLVLAVSSLLALSVGLSNGALTYNFLLSLTKLGLVNPMMVSIFPTVALVATAIFCVCVTALMLSAFVGLLREPNLFTYLLSPLKEIETIFSLDQPYNKNKSTHQLWLERIITYIAMGVGTTLGLFGLIAIQVQGGVSLAVVLKQTTTLTAEIISLTAYGISAGLALVGQLPFIIQSSFKGVLMLVEKLKVTSTEQSKQQEGIIKKISKAVLSIVSAACNGNIVRNTFSSKAINQVAFTAAATNVITGMLASESSSVDKKKIADATADRVKNLKIINKWLAITKQGEMRKPTQVLSASLYAQPIKYKNGLGLYFFTTLHRRKGGLSCTRRANVALR